MIIRNVKNVEILSKTLVDGTKEHFETIFYHQIFFLLQEEGNYKEQTSEMHF